MRKLLLFYGVLVMFGLMALPSRADFVGRSFGTPLPFPQVFRPLPLNPPLFNIAHPFVVTQQRWQVVVIPTTAEQPTSFVILVDTLYGTSFVLRPDPQQPSGFSWQLLDRQGAGPLAFP